MQYARGEILTLPLCQLTATKQAPLLLSIRYKVLLPDHGFVIATKHKLTLLWDYALYNHRRSGIGPHSAILDKNSN